MSLHRPTLRRLQLPGGLQLEAFEQGPRGGLPVLLLHGITDSWRSFQTLLPRLPAEWHVIALSQRGHGGSAAAAGYGARDFAADAAAVAALLGLAPMLVVGHSMGATNALRLAADHPGRVRGVVAAGAFAGYADKPELVAFVRDTIGALGAQVPRELAEAFQRDTVAGSLPPGLLDSMVDECLRTPAAVWRAAFAALLQDDTAALLRRVSAPVLLAWGDADAFVPEADQQRLQQALPRARRSVYRGTGHALHWEQPERFAADLVNFARGLQAEGTASRAAATSSSDQASPSLSQAGS